MSASMRKTQFIEGEIYHICNRGVDKRDVFLDQSDVGRFLISIQEFNSFEPVGSIRDALRDKEHHHKKDKPLVEIIAYCINSNHYHLLLSQSYDRGIEKFMQRLGNGYTKYFNSKYQRSGVLFQGKFKSKHIDTNTYLLQVSAYINLNDRFSKKTDILNKSSWKEYSGEENGICNKNIILDQYKTTADYISFAKSSLKDIIRRKSQKERGDDDNLGMFNRHPMSAE